MSVFKSQKLGKLEKQLERASSYAEWAKIAQQHDKLSGAEKWKKADQSRLYDYSEIGLRLHQLKQLQGRNDNHGLMFTLNEGIHGNMGGMGKPVLYSQAKLGTKYLITDYIDEITKVLDTLAFSDSDDINIEEKIDFFHRASHCFGRSALMLSGAGTLGLFHIGQLRKKHTLWKKQLED